MADRAQPLIIRIDGFLDVSTAADVVRRLVETGRERAVLIEFGARAKCDLIALSFVAEAISRRGTPVSVHGLSGHDLRILRYLGVSFPVEPEEPTE